MFANLRQAYYCTAGSAVISLMLFYTGLLDSSESLLRPHFFRLRQIMGKEPPLSPDLTVFVLGDSSAAAIQGTDLPIAEWAIIFKKLQDQGARDILIDKIFSFESEQRGIESFKQRLRGLAYIPVTGAFVSEREIFGRPALPINHHALNLEDWITASDEPTPNATSPNPLYAASPSLAEALTRPGLLNYEDGHVPLMILKSHNSGIPFAAARLASTHRISGAHLYLNEKRVPTFGTGKVLVNFLSPEALRKKKFSLQSLREAIAQKIPIPEVGPGSTVLILTSYYTGGSQPISTPFGALPSGSAQIALANSVLTNRWISPTPKPYLFILVAALLGGLLTFPRLRLSWIGMIGICSLALMVASSSLLFVYSGLLFPVSICLIAFSLSFFPVLSYRLYAQRREHRLISSSLNGLVPQEGLRRMLQTGAREIREPQAYNLSILFLDLVGFSDLAEKTTPKESFAILKDLLTELTESVHRNGGIIDKTLGDGLLCFFGLNADGTLQPDHADRAVRCAIEIQSDSIKKCLTGPSGSPVLPFRIGINSGSVVMGDLGSENRIDLTVVGANVNMAKRYETAATPFGFVIGETTLQQLTSEDLLQSKPMARWFPVKHYSDPVKAYEFYSALEQADAEKAREKYRNFKNLVRKETRLTPGLNLTVDCGWFGKGEVLNFSSGGFCISLPRYLGAGIHLRCEILFPDKSTQILLAEVRWGSIGSGGSFLHGLRILGLPEEQRLLLFERLKSSSLSQTRAA